MKVIVIAGIERGDFPFYASMYLHTVSEKTICIDNSKRGELFNAVSRDLKTGNNKAVMNNVTFLRNVAYSPDFFTAFDFIIIYQGENFDPMTIIRADRLYVMPDYKPASIERAKEIITDNAVVIMHDKAGKISDRALAALLNTDESKVLGGIPYNENDYNCYLSFLYNGSQRLNSLSREYIESLIYLYCDATGRTIKEAQKALKKVR